MPFPEKRNKDFGKFATNAYKALASYPNYTSAEITHLGDGFMRVSCISTQKDFSTLEKVKMKVSWSCREPDLKFQQFGFPEPADSIILERYSPCGSFRATLRSFPNEKNPTLKKFFVEIWDTQKFIKRVDVSDKHGDFYADEFFGCLNWSPDSKRLIYVAEKKRVEEGSFEKFQFSEDWGEKYWGKAPPCVVMVEVESGTVRVLDALLNLHLGQVVFSNNPNECFAIGVETLPKQYGIIFCNNRQTAIYKLMLDSNSVECISDKNLCSQSPRMNEERTKLVYLQYKELAPHTSCAKLMMYDIVTRETTCIVPCVELPNDKSPFPGLYLSQLPNDCWAKVDQNNSDLILCSGSWKSRESIIAISVTTGKVYNLTSDEAHGSYTFLVALKDYIVATRSSIKCPFELLFGCIRTNGGKMFVDWVNLDSFRFKDIEVESMLKSNSWNVYEYPEIFQNDGFHAVEAIVLQSTATMKDNDKYITPTEGKPLIVFPHGGPHSNFTTHYSPSCASFLSFGFNVVMVNYTGSTGFGQKSILSLIGKIGTLEVEEIQKIAEFEKRRLKSSKVFVYGGSHGGFIAGHLVGKYPDFYDGCIMRNPVLDLCNNHALSDIPEWSFLEAGLSFSLKQPSIANPKDYEVLYNSSPISRIERVKSPTLIMLGEMDRRVPIYQGMNWHFKLISLGVESIMMKYPKVGHGLDSVEAEVNGFETISEFLLYCMQKNV